MKPHLNETTPIVQNGKIVGHKESYNESMRLEDMPSLQSVETSLFSDNCLLSMVVSDFIALHSLIFTVQKIQQDLLESHKVICRGAIHAGKAFHKGSYIFGPAITEAYLMEQKTAIYPRVILTESFLKLLLEDSKLQPYFDSRIIVKDYDGAYFINYLLHNLAINKDGENITLSDQNQTSSNVALNKSTKKTAEEQISFYKTSSLAENKKQNILNKWGWVSNLCDKNLLTLNSK